MPTLCRFMCRPQPGAVRFFRSSDDDGSFRLDGSLSSHIGGCESPPSWHQEGGGQVLSSAYAPGPGRRTGRLRIQGCLRTASLAARVKSRHDVHSLLAEAGDGHVGPEQVVDLLADCRRRSGGTVTVVVDEHGGHGVAPRPAAPGESVRGVAADGNEGHQRPDGRLELPLSRPPAVGQLLVVSPLGDGDVGAGGVAGVRNPARGGHVHSKCPFVGQGEHPCSSRRMDTLCVGHVPAPYTGGRSVFWSPARLHRNQRSPRPYERRGAPDEGDRLPLLIRGQREPAGAVRRDDVHEDRIPGENQVSQG